MKTLIKNIDILSMDESKTQYENGVIIIDGDHIAFLGEAKDMDLRDKDFLKEFHEVIDGRGKLAIPGLINTHTHASMVLFRGYANDLPLMDWLEEKIWPREDKLVKSDAYWLSLLAIAEMIKGGVTAFADMYMFMEETARAVLDSGVRGVLSRGLQGPDKNSKSRLDESESLWKNWQGAGGGRITVMLGPHSIYTCEPSYLKEIKGLSEKLGLGIHIHLSETRQEVEDSFKKHGKSPVGLLESLGLLDGHVLAAHCVHLSDEDLKIIKDYDVRVSHCPVSNLKLGSGIAPIGDMVDMGITVSLGTDGAASNNNLSVMKEMAFASLITKGTEENATLIPADIALEMATKMGARALNLEGITGTLSPGKKADIVLIDTDSPNYFPKGDLTTHLVYSGNSKDVDTVFVNGVKLMENRQLLTIDMDRVYDEVNKIYKRVLPDKR